MSTNEKDYSAYIAYQSSGMQVYSLFVAFTFTVITLLLTLLPDPHQMLPQVTLFFISILFDIFLFLTFSGFLNLSKCADHVPPIDEKEQRRSVTTNFMYLFSLVLWGVAMTLMFLLWNLTILALASGVVYVLFVILILAYVYRPIAQHWNELRSKK